MSQRGMYGVSLIGSEFVGADPGGGGSSALRWIVGGLAVGGAVLWARHQSKQVGQLYKNAGLPYESFAQSLREDARRISSAARERVHHLTRPRAIKEGA